MGSKAACVRQLLAWTHSSLSFGGMHGVCGSEVQVTVYTLVVSNDHYAACSVTAFSVLVRICKTLCLITLLYAIPTGL